MSNSVSVSNYPLMQPIIKKMAKIRNEQGEEGMKSDEYQKLASQLNALIPHTTPKKNSDENIPQGGKSHRKKSNKRRKNNKKSRKNKKNKK